MKKPYVGDTVLHHNEALEPTTKSEALHLLWVEASVFEHIWVERPTPCHLEPFTLFARCLVPRVYLNRWLGKREIRRAEPHPYPLPQILTIEAFERPLQMSETHVFTNCKTV